MPDSPRLPLTVNVPADDWATGRRRVAYLEDLLIGMADRFGLDAEWYDVERLAGLWGRPPRPANDPAPDVPVNLIPVWVLPMMRLLRGEAEGDLGAAWAKLPDHLPAGVPMPGEREAARVLLTFGLA